MISGYLISLSGVILEMFAPLIRLESNPKYERGQQPMEQP